MTIFQLKTYSNGNKSHLGEEGNLLTKLIGQMKPNGNLALRESLSHHYESRDSFERIFSLQDALPVPLSDTQWSSVTINVTNDSCPQFNPVFLICLCGVKIVC